MLFVCALFKTYMNSSLSSQLEKPRPPLPLLVTPFWLQVSNRPFAAGAGLPRVKFPFKFKTKLLDFVLDVLDVVPYFDGAGAHYKPIASGHNLLDDSDDPGRNHVLDIDVFWRIHFGCL